MAQENKALRSGQIDFHGSGEQYASRGRGSVPPWRRGGRGRGRSPAAVELPGKKGASVVPETEELPEEAPVEETGPEQLGGAEGAEELASGPDWSPNEESVAQQAAETGAQRVDRQ